MPGGSVRGMSDAPVEPTESAPPPDAEVRAGMDTARELLAQMPLTRHLGVRPQEASPTRVVLVLPDLEFGHNHLGGPHAGATYTLAETCSGTLVTLAFAERLADVEPLAVHAEVDYRRFATGQLRATATFEGSVAEALAVLDAGRRPEIDVAVVVAQDDGTVTATLTVRWTLRRKRPREASAAARATARIVTDRGPRYVKQLVSHLGHKLSTSLGEDGVGVIGFPTGRCVLAPADDHIEARAEAVDAEALAVVQDVVARHLVRFASTGELVVDWVAQG